MTEDEGYNFKGTDKGHCVPGFTEQAEGEKKEASGQSSRLFEMLQGQAGMGRLDQSRPLPPTTIGATLDQLTNLEYQVKSQIQSIDSLRYELNALRQVIRPIVALFDQYFERKVDERIKGSIPNTQGDAFRPNRF